MRTYEALAAVAIHIAARRQAAHLKGHEEEEKLWRYLRALCDFVHVTGQVYQFEDFLKGTATELLHVRHSLSTQEGFAQLALELLLTPFDEPADPAEEQHVRILISLLHFITETEQLEEVEDFFSNLLEYAPVAIAYFPTHVEAEAWLKCAAEPPSPAYLLIGDEYYQFWYLREDNTRGMYRDYAIEPALEALSGQGIPSQVPSFSTRAEAETWMRSHPANPYAFVAIAGEHYFVVYHRRLKRHSFHPVTAALEAWEKRKRAVELELAREATAQGKEPSGPLE